LLHVLYFVLHNLCNARYEIRIVFQNSLKDSNPSVCSSPPSYARFLTTPP
jgi:hypothetical protein